MSKLSKLSKLSKFRSHIRFDEAAALLSRLIGEPVSIDQLVSLHEQGWLSVYRPCFHELVHLSPKKSMSNTCATAGYSWSPATTECLYAADFITHILKHTYTKKE